MIVELMSSSGNNGSSTDTGLGLSVLSLAPSRSTCLVVEQLGGDVTGEDSNWSCSNESYRKNKISL